MKLNLDISLLLSSFNTIKKNTFDCKYKTHIYSDGITKIIVKLNCNISINSFFFNICMDCCTVGVVTDVGCCTVVVVTDVGCCTWQEQSHTGS